MHAPPTFVVLRARSGRDRERALALRLRVFVGEQGVPEAIERDDLDAVADHVIAEDGAGTVVATGRLVPLGGGRGKVGRMAVLAPFRGRGAGAAVLQELERAAVDRDLEVLLLHAQVTARGFYERAGYRAHGEVFEEAGIAHVEMRKTLPARTPTSS